MSYERESAVIEGVSEGAVLQFARETLDSVWTLDLLVLISSEARVWGEEDLKRELRANAAIVRDSLHVLSTAGLIDEKAGGWRFAPASSRSATLAEQLVKLYSVKPMTVVKEVLSVPNQRIRTFADAFKLRS